MATESTLSEEVSRTILPEGADLSSYLSVFNELSAKDIAADFAWLEIAGKEQYDSRRLEMRERMIDAMGGFPERTPLNARTLSRIVRDGYTVEKVVFESFPGIFVTANLFLPSSASPDSRCSAVVMSCGHSAEGKDADIYIRACVLAVRAGLAVLMFDPYEQGERRRTMKTVGLCRSHNVLGIKASLLGWSFSAMRCWDGIRAIDYMETRPEVDPSRIGYMGNSGGGTMTALMECVEPRIRAAAPSCYISSLREVCDHLGPQDAEQNIFGQLSFGLNHAGFVLIPDIPVGISCCFGDMFDYYGTQSTFAVADALTRRIGKSGQVALIDAPGPHGWKESTESASADWIKERLADPGCSSVPDMARYRLHDIGFDLASSDLGLAPEERGVCPGGDAFTLPGACDINDLLAAKASAMAAEREGYSRSEKAGFAVMLSGLSTDRPARVINLGSGSAEGRPFERIAFMYENGFAIPAVLLNPESTSEGEPVVMVTQHGGRASALERASRYLEEGRAVLIADITATGEIGTPKHVFYGNPDNPEEGISVMLYLMGESMTGRRATDIIRLGDYMAGRFNRKSLIDAEGNTAVAAAHAFAAGDKFFSSVITVDPPLSWSDFLSTDGTVEYGFTTSVNGAMRFYDWTDLLP